MIEFKKYSPLLICKKCETALANADKLKKAAGAADNFFRKQTKDEEERLWKIDTPDVKDIIVKTEDETIVIEPQFSFHSSINTSDGAEFNRNFSDNDEDFTMHCDDYDKEDDYFSEPIDSEKISKAENKRIKRKSYNNKFKCECGKGFNSRPRLEEHITSKKRNYSRHC